MEYENFDLQIGPLSHEGLLVRVQRSPAGEGEAFVRTPSISGEPMPLEDVARHLRAEVSGLLGSPTATGGYLFRSIFTGPIGALFLRSLSRIEAPSRGLRICLRTNLLDPTAKLLQGVPWELLYREDTEDFLALDRRTPIVRSLDVPRSPVLRPYEPPLRILAVLARDPESPWLNLEEEVRQIQEALHPNPAIRFEVLQDPDTQTIRRALDLGRFHILHYMGHAAFESESGKGALLFEGPDGRLPITGHHLATKIKDLDALRLVVLNACETAVAGGRPLAEPFAGVAAALVLGGVPGVVAMQSPIRDKQAVDFASSLYERLARGMPIEQAVTEGRQAIHSLDPEGVSWAVPVLFLRSAGAPLFAVETIAPVPEVEAASPSPVPPEPVLPEPERMLLGRLPALALLLGLVVAALGSSSVFDWHEDRPVQSSVNTTSVVPEPSLETRSVEPFPTPRTTPQEAKPPAARVAQEIPLEASGLQLSITGSPPSGFQAALRKEAQRLAASGLPVDGRTARVDVDSAQCSSSAAGSISGISCHIEARVSLGGRALNPVQATGWQSDEPGAREIAAGKLAHNVIARIATSLKEGSR